jgi:D-glycero-D-manno-heptose 1,7-bisphosphate phosphatase
MAEPSTVVPVQVALLCGGLATRMRPLSERLPKSLFPVGGRAFIDWQLEAIARGGASDVLLCVGHRGDAIRAHLGKGRPFGLRVAWSDEGEGRLGTGGALAQAAARGLLWPRFVVQYGDSYLRLDHRALLGAPGEAALAVFHNAGRWDASNCVVENQRVLAYQKGTGLSDARWIDYGAAALDRSLVEQAPTDLAELYTRLAAAGRLTAVPVGQRFYEVGSPAGLAELEAFLAAPRPACFLDRDGVIIELLPDGLSVREVDQVRLLPGAAAAIHRLRAAGLRTIVVTNQPGPAKGLYTRKSVEESTARLGALLAETGTAVDDILICLHHPEGGPGGDPQLVGPCECRKPRPGMLLEAARRHRLDLGASFLVGDRETDVQAGQAAGCRGSLLIGSPGLPDLAAAAEHILAQLE